MSDSSESLELKAILRGLLAELEEIQANQYALSAAIKPLSTYGDILDAKKTGKSDNAERFAKLRQQIEAL